MMLQDEDKTKAELIAELKQLRQRQDELCQECDFLRQVININPHFIFAKDREGRFTLANPAFARAYADARAEALLGKTDADINPNQALVEQYRQDDMAVMESNRDLVISEERVVKPGGRILWRETIKRPIVGDDGKAHQVLGIITDITRQKQAKDALQLTQFSLDNAADAVFWLGPDAEFLYVNKAACHSLGYSLDELLELRLFDIDPTYSTRNWKQLWEATKANPVTVESNHHPKNGLPYPVQARLTYLEFNHRAYCVVFARDISLQKQTTEALKDSENRLRTVLSNTPIIVFALDQHGNFTLSEGRGLEAIDQQPGEAVGRSIFDIYQDHPPIIEHASYALAGEANALTTEIGDVAFEVWYEPLRDQNNQVTGVVGVAYDVTERKQAETAIAQALDQALEASRLKSQLLAKVSHELRTPLGAILGYTELLQDGVFGPITEEQTRIAAEVIDSTNYLTNLVNELLDQAQFESGRAKLKIMPFALHDMIHRVYERMRVLARTKKLGLIVKIEPDVPETIASDERRLQQIVMNLVSNAIKFTESGTVRLDVYCPAPYLWAIKVSDTGPGIPAEARTYIFEPFHQLDGTMTREHIGTGLGLSIVRQLVKLMDGAITLDSEVGKGSTFIVELPIVSIE